MGFEGLIRFCDLSTRGYSWGEASWVRLGSMGAPGVVGSRSPRGLGF